MSSCSTNNSSSLPIGGNGATGATGAIGANGTNGTNGTTVVYSNISPVTTASGSFETLQSYTLPAGGLAANGDTLELVCFLSVDITTNLAGIRLYMGGNLMIPIPPTSFFLVPGSKYCLFKAYITRQSATTVLVQFDVKYSAAVSFTTTGSSVLMNYNATVNNLTSATNSIEIRGSATAAAPANVLTAHSLLIFKYQA